MENGYMKEFKGRCLTCVNFDLQEQGNNKMFKCQKYGRYMTCDDSCSKYSYNCVRTNAMIEDAFKEPCYITTILCTILGYEDDCKYLTSFRIVRESMKNHKEGRNILHEYDVYGPLIADKLHSDFNTDSKKTTEFAKLLEQNFLQYIDYLIGEKNYCEAIYTYYHMTLYLLGHYNIEYKPLQYTDSDTNNLGHARKRQTK